MEKLNIALTMGDPAGIGPELIAKTLAAQQFADRARFILYGSRAVFEDALRGVETAAEYDFCETADICPGSYNIGEASGACDYFLRSTNKYPQIGYVNALECHANLTVH